MRLPVSLRAMLVPNYPVRVMAFALSRLYENLPALTGLLVLVTLATVVVMWGRIGHELLLAWLAVGVVIYTIRYAFARAFQRRQPRNQDAIRWGHYYTLTLLANGFYWGSAGLLFFVPESIGHQVFLYVLILGMVGTAIFITAYWPPGYYAFGVPLLGFTIVNFASMDSLIYHGMAVVIPLYVLVLARIGWTMHRSVLDAIALRFENLDLIEQLQEQKHAAEEANVAKSRFLAAASHDLRQPLHALSLFVSVMRERIHAPELRPLVENVSSSVAALEGLFQTLLDVSRLDAGIVQPKLVDFRLSELLDRLAAEYRVHATAKGLRLTTDYSDAVVHSDPALLELILRNLLSNAIRYTPQGGVILRCVAVEGGIRLEVDDSGIGIPSDKHKEIFREFAQLGNPERDRAKGLGLGLAIVRRVAALLQHPIELRSQPGAGSCFSTVLPLGGSDMMTVLAAQPVAVPGVSLEGLTIVVIDDEAIIRDGMQAVLEDWGCNVIATASGAEAIETLRAQQQTPNIVVADHRLRNERTGVQEIVLLQREFGSEIPGVIVTGDTAPERLREAQASGYVLLHKPVAPAKLRATLQRLRRGRRRSDAPK